MSCGSFSLLASLWEVRKAGWPAKGTLLNLEILWWGDMSSGQGRVVGKQDGGFLFFFFGRMGCSFLFKVSFLGKQTKD